MTRRGAGSRRTRGNANTAFAGLIAAAMLGAPTRARADDRSAGARPAAPDAVASPSFRSVKDRALDRKRAAPDRSDGERARWHRELDRRIGKPATPPIIIYNTWTREYLAVEPRPPAARRGPPAVPEPTRDRFLRCRFTNQPTAMDPRLLDALVRAAEHFGSRRIDIVSAYRSPKYNLILRKKGREVARNSQHTHGRAVDFRVRGVSTKPLRDWARKQRLGGVGYYPHSRFIHMDTGPIRTWTGR